jgi:hypothetical protein
MTDQPASARRTLVAQPLAPAAAATSPDPDSVTPAASPKISNSVSSRVPKYLTLVRREARIHEHQATELTRLSRHLNRLRTQQGSTGERITDNTLIRVAIDLLLQHEPQLAGTSEDELRSNLGLSQLPD